jgi:hypothetical protein
VPGKTGRLLAALAGTGLLLIATATTAAPAGAWGTPHRPRPAAVDPGPVQIHSAGASHQYRFRIALPAGARLKPASAATPDEVLVLNARGTAIGAYDAAWAADADGRSVPTSYRVSGNQLIQTVDFDRKTHFPITIDPGYSPIGSTPGAGADPVGPASGSEFSPMLGAAASSVTKVTVPSNYVYNPALGYLHDYCTDSPDEFPAPAAPNADFRGPCARHDLCYAGSTDQFVCDNALRKDMYTNCTYYYSSFSVLRPLCKATADIYWAAVVIT